MDEFQVLEKITERAEGANNNYKLRCSDAFEIAKELGIEVSMIGRICNANNIKITACQLGCFK